MPWQPVPIVGGSAADSVRPYSSQDSINYIPEASESAGTQTPTILRGAPGLDFHVEDSTGAGERGAHDVEGRYFRVVGTVLQEVKPDGSTVDRGTIGGSGRVSMQHNQITSGSQLAIGTGGSLGYVFNTVTNALTVINTDHNVKAILINIFGGITRGDEVARGIVEALQNVDLHAPLVIRIDGTNSTEGRAILKQYESDRLISATTMLEAAQKAVALAGASVGGN